MFAVIFAAVFALLVSSVVGETHTITFNNQCGHGTPQLIENGQVVSNGTAYTKSGAFSGIAYLQTGNCLFNGEACTLLETTLVNPTCAGCGSSTDISLIDPHVFNVPVAFAYTTGSCVNTGAACTSPNCHETAFFASDDTQVQVSCQEDNADLTITFCGGQSQVSASSSSAKPAAAHTTTAAPQASVTPQVDNVSANVIYKTVYACDRAHARDFYSD